MQLQGRVSTGRRASPALPASRRCLATPPRASPAHAAPAARHPDIAKVLFSQEQLQATLTRLGRCVHSARD